MRKVWTPRKFQPAGIAHILDHKRCALFASMGSGKSVMTLTALDILYLAGIETKPAIVFAPLRVAKDTWSDEAARWEHLRDIKVSQIVGTADERRAALARKANVYTCNFENIEWLAAELNGVWPFGMTIIDESSRVKSFRGSETSKGNVKGKGSKRALTLAKMAFAKSTRWLNLTGTPAPNGLQDLWGAQFYVDGGERLGRTFTAFKNRWFRSVPGSDGYHQIEIMPFSEAQIHAAIRDVCLTIDMAQHYDIGEFIDHTIFVDLPPKAAKAYKEMEKKLYTELTSGEKIEALSAASKSQKCIAEGTPVLTKRGPVPIEQITRADLMWDGVEWVSSYGLVCNDYMSVVQCEGVWMTDDHKVLTTSGWAEAKDIINGKSSERFKRASVRLPDGYSQGGHHDGCDAESHLATALRVRSGSASAEPELAVQTPGPAEVVRMQVRRNDGVSDGLARHDWPPSVELVDRHASSMPESARQGLEKLRRARHHCLQKVAGFIRELLGRYGQHLASRADPRQDEKQQGVFASELQMGDRQRAGQQHAQQCLHRHAERSHDGVERGPSVWAAASNAGAQAELARLGPPARRDAARTSKVYDLVNCGPRRRFTVMDENGEMLIVHNCSQFASGAAYLGEAGDYSGDRPFEVVHDEKMYALESIVEEAAGMPLLVAYQHKSDLARLLKWFPKGRHFDKNPKTKADFIAGKIPLLFLHPASAAHGVDGLQHASNIIVFFSQNWNSEEYQQASERIGPTRQFQSGYKRPVFRYHICARKTVDEVVMERRKSKITVQDALLEYLKRKDGES